MSACAYMFMDRGVGIGCYCIIFFFTEYPGASSSGPWRRSGWVFRRRQHWRAPASAPGSVAGSGSREWSAASSRPLPSHNYPTTTAPEGQRTAARMRHTHSHTHTQTESPGIPDTHTRRQGLDTHSDTFACTFPLMHTHADRDVRMTWHVKPKWSYMNLYAITTLIHTIAPSRAVYIPQCSYMTSCTHTHTHAYQSYLSACRRIQYGYATTCNQWDAYGFVWFS